MHTAPERPGWVIHPLLQHVFTALEESGDGWLLLRGENDLLRPAGDVDLLIAITLLPRLDQLLGTLGFVRVLTPGHGSHRFYFGYSAVDDFWLKLDIVSDLAFGPLQQFHTSMASSCLYSRVRLGMLWLPAPSDQAWLQLLHLLIDKGEIAANREEQALKAGQRACLHDQMAYCVEAYLGSGSAAEILEVVNGRRFHEIAALSSRLRYGWIKRDPVVSCYRTLINRALRRIAPAVRGTKRRGLVMGVMGPDGAGKTSLLRSLTHSFPVTGTYVYMGMWSTSVWDPLLRRLPGGRLAKRLIRLLRASARANCSRLQGSLVLLDRVPHDTKLPGSLDNTFGGRVSAALAFAVGPKPDVLLFLDAPGAVMYARKGEHSIELLEKWRRAYLDLSAGLPEARVVDATQSQDEVRRQAIDEVWKVAAADPGRTKPGSARGNSSHD